MTICGVVGGYHMVIAGAVMTDTRKSEQNAVGKVVMCHVVHHMTSPNTDLDAHRL